MHKMFFHGNYMIFLPLLLLLLHTGGIRTSADTIRKPYIIYLGNAPSSRANARSLHYRFLSKAVGEVENVRDLMIYSYLKSFNAFAAKLSREEAQRLAGMDGVLSVFPSATHKLHTSRSWDFLGFPQTAKRSVRESNVVIGFLDTGIWPDSASFDDSGLGPPPPRWKGKCDRSRNFTCNNKIIGARFYRLGQEAADEVAPGESASPLDTEGHGTHTASTAAGTMVAHASLYGLGEGTARGGAPSARIAMYKVCWFGGCQEVDMLAAFDQAIDDGVDIISASIGGFPTDYLNDVLAIGSFHAMKKGILTCLSGGNDGPILSTVSNVAPWALTVAATAIDRQFRTVVRLGHGRRVRGISLNTYEPLRKSYPLISGADAALVGSSSAAFCEEETLDKKKVKGKIVYCKDGIQPESVVANLGGAGVIKHGVGMLMDVAFLYELPSCTIGEKVTSIITKYINSTKNPRAVIYKSRAINVSMPRTASFSSRGPNPISLNVLKPDISAPGLNILAAWSKVASISESTTDKRRAKYNIVSGTSMACPHVSAVAAYIKSFHPRWSPAAIKSAIMTTAKDMSLWEKEKRKKKKAATELGYGSGVIDPLRALNPGLVYDMDETSYIQFLRKEGYNDSMIAILEGKKNRTSTSSAKFFSNGNNTRASHYSSSSALGSDGINYPSMQRTVGDESEPIRAVFRRRVTNVGRPRSVYKASVTAPRGLRVQVRPATLVFRRRWQRRSFKVVVNGEPLGSDRLMASASLVWRDGKHVVRSPIVVLKPINY